jgi:hypothetical protein
MGCMQHCMHCHAATAQGPGTASALQQTARAATKEMETRDAAYLSLLEIRASAMMIKTLVRQMLSIHDSCCLSAACHILNKRSLGPYNKKTPPLSIQHNHAYQSFGNPQACSFRIGIHPWCCHMLFVPPVRACPALVTAHAQHTALLRASQACTSWQAHTGHSLHADHAHICHSSCCCCYKPAGSPNNLSAS